MEPLEPTQAPWAQGVGRSNRPAPTKSLVVIKELILYLPSSSESQQDQQKKKWVVLANMARTSVKRQRPIGSAPEEKPEGHADVVAGALSIGAFEVSR